MKNGRKPREQVRNTAAVVLILLGCFLFAACGKGKDGQGDEQRVQWQAHYEELKFEKENRLTVLGVQHYGGEIVCLFADRENGVILCPDGKTGRTICSNVREEYVTAANGWWLDAGGAIFVLGKECLIKLSGDGNEEYRISLPGSLTGLCRGDKGELWGLLQASDRFASGILQIDEEKLTTGEIDWQENIVNSISYVSGRGLLLTDAEGIFYYSAEKEYLLEWRDTQYSQKGMVWEVDCPSDDEIKILAGEKAVTLTRGQVQEADKVILTYKTTLLTAEEKEWIVRFNEENKKYYVEIQLYSEKEDGDVFAFRDQVQMEMAAGRGPDILNGYSVEDITVLQEKGALEELSAYMADSGLKGESLFPICTQQEEDGGIYKVIYGAAPITLFVRDEVVGEEGRLDQSTLLSGLENYSGGRCFMNGRNAQNLLRMWLADSESLYGMLDLQGRTCDFTKGDMERLLALAEKVQCTHGFSGQESAECLAMAAQFTEYTSYPAWDAVAKRAKMVMTGYPADAMPATHYFEAALYMNAQSDHKEGVWEFMEYMLGKEVQLALGEDIQYLYLPVLKEAFLEAGQKSIGGMGGAFMLAEAGDVETTFTEEDLTALYELMDGIRTIPSCPSAIREIICEEAERYFDGNRSAEEVCGLIQNRVQLYLDEQGYGL